MCFVWILFDIFIYNKYELLSIPLCEYYTHTHTQFMVKTFEEYTTRETQCSNCVCLCFVVEEVHFCVYGELWRGNVRVVFFLYTIYRGIGCGDGWGKGICLIRVLF